MSVDTETIRQVFELEKTAVNPTDLAQRISINLQTRPLKLPADWPSFALTTNAESTIFTSHLQKVITDAIKAYDQIWLEPSISVSDNSFLARLKRPFHQLVLFYVNKLGQKQIIFNDRLLRAVQSLVNLDDEKSREIESLRAQIDQLQQQAKDLGKK